MKSTGVFLSSNPCPSVFPGKWERQDRWRNTPRGWILWLTLPAASSPSCGSCANCRIYSHMLFLSKLSSLFLIEKESLAKILTIFSTLFLHSLYLSFTRVSINVWRRHETLVPPSTLQRCISIFILVAELYQFDFLFVCFTFHLFLCPPQSLVSTYLISAYSWFWLYFSTAFLDSFNLFFFKK